MVETSGNEVVADDDAPEPSSSNLDVASLLATTSQPDAQALQAGTVVLLRAADDGCECLMLAKTKGQSFGGLWVFPGGRVEEHEGTGLEGARRAAVREAAEETRLELDPTSLVPLSYWVPPPEAPKRFLTWFFVAEVPADASAVQVDGQEISDHVWTCPAEALESHARGDTKLLPPTWITLHELVRLGVARGGRGSAEPAGTATSAVGALRTLAAQPPTVFATRIVDHAGVPVALWEPDAAYPANESTPPGSLATIGPRHRLSMDPAGWSYERDT
jgi:8-oxo-dGTP pyrophosphatase MutT (NUDIX family)